MFIFKYYEKKKKEITGFKSVNEYFVCGVVPCQLRNKKDCTVLNFVPYFLHVYCVCAWTANMFIDTVFTWRTFNVELSATVPLVI